MSTISSIVIIVYYMISILYIIILYKKYKLCPELLWCASQLAMFFGITHFIDSKYKSDNLLLILYLIALVCFIISSNFTQRLTRPNRRIITEKRSDYYKSRRIYIWIMMLSSIVLCGWFFVRGGGNVFLNGVRALIRGTDYSTKYSRMGLLSVSGVGYIYQLRVIIFPLLVLYYIMINKVKFTSIVLTIIMLSFLVGTGQRGGLFSFIAIVMICLHYMYGKKEDSDAPRKHNSFILYAGVIGVSGVLFSISTILNGRVAEGRSVFSAILQRFLEDNQSCAVKGFRYISAEPIQYGRDWLMQLIDILPGQNSYVSLDTRIFAYLNGGSTAGTSPACIWGSAYYNFGIFGVVLLSIILGFALTKLHSRFSSKVNDECSVIIYSAEQFLLAYWVAAGPIVLFNSGFVSVLLLNMIMLIALKYPLVIGHKSRFKS